MDFWYRIRFPLLFSGMVALLAGLWAGLLRLGWDFPLLTPDLPESHGPLMVACFLSVVIGLERAVALGHRWAYATPFFTGIGGFIYIFASSSPVGPILITIGAVSLVIINTVIIALQPALFTVIMGIGSIALLVGDIMWVLDFPIYQIVIWWAGFLILTITAERLELSRFLKPSKLAQTLFLIACAMFMAGMLAMSVSPDIGTIPAGIGILALTLWLGKYDIARRTIRQTGLTRFVAVCLLSGYVWLGVGGTLFLFSGVFEPGQYYDATLHAIFVGFVLSMIFGHAPIIFPAVLKVEVPYTPRFYSHLALLHVSLILRIASDLGGLDAGQMWGGLINEIAILMFIANTAGAVVGNKLKSKPA